ncbi:hypothetical protein ACJX0J_030230, partial [Zea mays]
LHEKLATKTLFVWVHILSPKATYYGLVHMQGWLPSLVALGEFFVLDHDRRRLEFSSAVVVTNRIRDEQYVGQESLFIGIYTIINSVQISMLVSSLAYILQISQTNVAHATILRVNLVATHHVFSVLSLLLLNKLHIVVFMKTNHIVMLTRI